jgi:PAS domain S-box-containing protein
MLHHAAKPSGQESPMDENEIIVTKTDLKGRITYANDVFLRISQLSNKQAIGQPHNLIRHPEMPRCVFKLLWDALEAKEEIFAYVVNMATNGDHYWVLAHVTPSFDAAGNVVGYHSMRRKPEKAQIETIIPLYKSLLAEEQKIASRKESLVQSSTKFLDLLKQKGLRYDQFVLAI